MNNNELADSLDQLELDSGLYQHFVSIMTDDIVASLKTAIELGKWSDGKRLSKKQLENSLQLVIAYESLMLPEDQRLGYIADNACRTSDKTH